MEAQSLLHYWNFNDAGTQLTPNQTLAGASGTWGVSPGGADVQSGTGQDFTGANAVGTDGAGAHLRVNNPVNHTMTVGLPTTGHEDAVIRYETRRSGSGAGTQVIEYTTDGTAYTFLQNVTTADAAPVVITLDFSGIAAADNNPLFGLRISFQQGAGGTVGNNRFDNFTVHGTALPSENTPPQLAAVGNQSLEALQTLSLNLSGTDSDLPAQALSYSLVSGPAGMTVSAAGALDWTPSVHQAPGVFPVTVQVADDGVPSLNDSETFEVTVSQSATALLLHAWNFNTAGTLLSPSQTLAGTPGTLATSPVSATDVLADSGQSFAGLNAVGTDGAGTHLRVNNPLGYTLNFALPTSGHENVLVRYETRRSGSGAGTQVIEYTTDGTGYQSLATVPTVAPSDVAPAVVELDFSDIAAADNNPLFGLRITFQQGTGGTGGNNRFDNVTVRGAALPPAPDNTAPTLATVENQTVAEGTELALTLSGSDTDVPAQILSYSVVSGPEGLTVSPTGALSWTPTEAQGPGVFPVTVQVTDNGVPALSGTARFEVTVSESNQAPVLANPGTPSVEELGTLTLQLQATDGDLPAQTLTYTLVSGPEGLTVGPTGDVIWTPTAAQAAGSYPVTVQVSDDAVPPLDDSETFEVTVTRPPLVLVHYWNFDDASVVPASLLRPTVTPPQTSASLEVTADPAPAVVSTLQSVFREANDLGLNGLGIAGTQLRVRTALVRTMTLRLPTTWVRDPVVRYRAQRETAGPELQHIAYTLDGVEYVPLQTESIPTGSVALVTLDFSAIDGADNNPHFGIQVTFSQGAGQTTGHHHFDNLTLHGLPFPAGAPSTAPRLTEVMSSNVETASDFEDNGEDWVEVYNPQSTPINLQGYGLSDDPAEPFKWVFPHFVMFPGEHRIVFASEKAVTGLVLGYEAHADFKISSTGETIVLTAPGGATADQMVVPALAREVSIGRLEPEGTTLRFFRPATPGAPNVGPGFDGILAEAPSLTSPPGFYASAVQVGANPPAGENIVLRYTLNGDEPTETSPVLTGPVTLASRAGQSNLWSSIPTATDEAGAAGYLSWSTGTGWSNGPVALNYKINTLRVRAFRDGFVPSRTVSGSYIVDPAGATRYDIPVVSIMADYASFFSPERGIMRAPTGYYMRGLDWERPAHLEFFENGGLGFEQDVGIRIHGNATRRIRLKSFRLVARSQYGTDAITYPVFPDHPLNVHERLILRSGGSDWHQVPFRDAFIQSLYKGVSKVPIQYHRSVAVFINGEFWGIERLRDRYDNNYFGVQFGVDDVDHLETAVGNPGRIQEGTNTHYFALTSYLEHQDLNAPGVYDHVKSQMDVENFRDFQIMQTFCANSDQPASNIQYWRSRTVDPSNPYADGRWRWLLYDLDRGFGWGSGDHTREMFLRNTGLSNITSTVVVDPGLLAGDGSIPPAATLVLRRMLSNDEFRRDFIIRFSDLLNTAFESSHVQTRLAEFQAELEPYMPEQIARWGYPRSMSEWYDKVEEVRSFAVLRPQTMREHIRAFFNLGGTNRVTVDVAAAGTGKIQVNTVTVGSTEPGLPPTPFPWSGTYFQGFPVTFTAKPEPGYQFSHWTGDVPAGQETSPTFSLPLTADVSVSAVFEPAPIPVLRQYWAFNNTGAPLGSLRLAAGDAGIQSSLGGGAAVLFSEGQEFSGINAQLGEGAGAHLRVNNPLGAQVIFRMPTTGVEDVVVRLETRRSGSGAGIQVWEYTTDGTEFAAFRTNSVADGAPALVTFDLTGEPGVDNNPLFALRVRFEQGTGGTVGNNRFDNITLHGLLLPGFEVAAFPTVSPLEGAELRAGGALNLTLTPSDADAGPETLTMSLVSGPSGLVFDGSGPVVWTPTVGQVGTQGMVVRVTDSSVPALSSTLRVPLVVLAANAPDLARPGDLTVNELEPMGFTLNATDPDTAPETLIYSLVSGPSGLGVSASGAVAWTPTETQGPGVYPVVVQVSDNSVPALSDTESFMVTVADVNQPPELANPGNLNLVIATELSLNLASTDADIPFNTRSHSLVSGPEGMTVSAAGLLRWNPSGGQGLGAYPVTVRVADNGTPPLQDEETFTVTIVDVPPRTVWQIGTDQVGSADPSAEFTLQNGKNDPAPGMVTRLAGDPQLNPNPALNPSADDDFYFSGVYPSGFNALAAQLSVPNDEPTTAWERGHTEKDTTNRLHLVLGNANVAPGASFRLNVEFPTGGYSSNAVVQAGFATHDMVVRFRNGLGAETLLRSQRIANPTNLVVDFLASDVGATLGANSLEIVRTDPRINGLSFWIRYDYLRLESFPDGNAAPVLTPPANQSVDELATLSLQLQATDASVPAQTLVYSLVSGPAGLTVSAAGAVSWTPTEAQGPGVYPVSVRVTDNGVPAMSDTETFEVTVGEVNTAPDLANPGNRIMDELATLSLSLTATDGDLPSQALVYSLVSGPAGLTVSAAGALSWTPTEAQGPGVYPVSVRVTDLGGSGLADTERFEITVNEVANEPPPSRLVWQIGTDQVGSADPSSEFSLQNGKNDARPGLVTRLAGDPLLNPTANPAADDDFYFTGNFPAGFNGLGAALVVPNDEPALAWERGHTEKDTTNRFHLMLEPGHLGATASFRLTMEFPTGGFSSNAVVQSGFATHDMLIRFRNGVGVETQLHRQVISAASTVTVAFAASAVQATLGANTVEIVRMDPRISGLAYWLRYDYVRLESFPAGNTAPLLTQPVDQSVDELATLSFGLSASDSDAPAQTLTYSLVSGPAGLTVGTAGAVSWTPTEAQGPGVYPVTVRVTDNGVPSLSNTKTFNVTVHEVADEPLRLVWQIGTDQTGSADPSSEFTIQNGRNDARPGLVTRV
ncbi:MAG: CotH kinase family protein, partial [Verrucomicrobia bacterium]|nr:CotH kinase family protein [Verrucomicrobiota bacterium]